MEKSLYVRRKIVNRWKHRKITCRTLNHVEKQQIHIYLRGEFACYDPSYSLSKHDDHARFSAREDLRTNIPFYFRHVPNQSWLLCCRGKCLFQVKQTDTSGPSLFLLFTTRPRLFRRAGDEREQNLEK